MRRALRSDHLILAAIGMLLGAAYAVYYVLRHPERLNLDVETDKVLLTLVAIAMGLLVMGLLFLLLRNLIKLLVERRRQVLGSRFRTKLVFIFLVLVLLPSIALFYAAASLIRQTNEHLFSEPIEQITEDSRKVLDGYLRLVRLDCQRFGEQIAREIAAKRLLDPDKAADLSSRAPVWLTDAGLDFVALYAPAGGSVERVFMLTAPRDPGKPRPADGDMVTRRGRTPAATARPAGKTGSLGTASGGGARSAVEPAPPARGDSSSAARSSRSVDGAPAAATAPPALQDASSAPAAEPPRGGARAPVPAPPLRFEDFAMAVIGSRESSNRLDRLGLWQRASAAVPLRSASPFLGPPGAVIVGRYITPDMASKTDTIDRAFREHRRALKNQPEVKRVYLGLFAILTLLVLFAATWTGFYLARQITVPIQALAEGTRAIISGDLDHRVTAQAGDEIGYLIESFNAMTGELKANRAAIETSRLQLQHSYQQLEERRQYIEQLLENVPVAVISVDGRGHVTTMNREAYRILRLDASRPAPGLRALEVFGREELAPLLAEIESLQRGESPTRVQEFELTIEGRPLHLAANISARRDAEGCFQGALIVMEDLSPLIRAQRTAAWQEVARRIAHEIKNPLTPIQLSAQRILKKFHERAEEFPRIVEEGVDIIVKEVATLQTLVDAFSRFARMPAIAPAPSDANRVVESALLLYDGIHSGITFRKDLETPLPAVRLDADQIKRVLINLIDNAIAAMDRKGIITLRTHLVPEDRVLRVVVEDDGPGIAPENKERLFVPYFSTKKRGTGLGLAIVNRIVSDHNGFIRVEDNVPQGTRFVIDLPA